MNHRQHSINKELANEDLPAATILASPTVEAVATSATDSESTGLSSGALAGIIVGVMAAAGAIGAAAYFYSQSPQGAPVAEGAIHASQVRLSLKSKASWAHRCPRRGSNRRMSFIEPDNILNEF